MNLKILNNECPICGKCSISASNQYCNEHKYLNENTYEYLLSEILNWPKWKLDAAIRYELFSPKVKEKIINTVNK